FVGRDIQKAYGQESQVLVTVPLLEGTDGINKMSKSYGNYVGIDEAPDEMFGKLMSISDDLMIKYYELLSDIPLDGLNALKAGMTDGTVHPKQMKVDFAKEIITRFHDKAAADAAHENFEKMFRDKGIPDDIESWSIQDFPDSISIPHLLKQTGMTPSTTEGIRMLEQGAVTVSIIGGSGFEKLSAKEIPKKDLIGKVIKVGKRKFKKLI
ncbi:MAG: tyrosyl-tRNA synthetase, partial [Deltaproteobacteria bacterium]|nr:tyrosyl-tRNA synthetase [Deltaproteobacteria bacterium]